MAQHVRWVAYCGDGVHGHWGAGNTRQEATAKMLSAMSPRDRRKYGGKARAQCFVSDLPFCSGSQPGPQEAALWIDDEGYVCSLRCKRDESDRIACEAAEVAALENRKAARTATSRK